MAFTKGKPKTGGKKKGTPNKKTRSIEEMREVLKSILDNCLDEVPDWIRKTAQRSPGKAVELITNIAEYSLPKLSRTEHTGKDGEKISFIIMTNDPNYTDKIKEA